FHGVKSLIHLLQVILIEGLKADQHALASAGRDQLQEFFIVCSVDACLTHPTNLEFCQLAEEGFCLIHIGWNVVIYEEDERFIAHLVQSCKNVVHRTACLCMIEHSLHCAKVASEVTAASCLHQADR